MKTPIAGIVCSVMLGIASLVPASPAVAADYGKKVTFDDLDLDQPADVRAMYERIRAAARFVCRHDLYPWDGQWASHYKNCIEGAVDKAVRNVNNVSLTALHEGKTRRVASR